MAADLGKTSKAMILRNHGLLALGETVREAFEVMYYLDAACQIQVDACAGGMHNVHLMSEQAAKTASTQFKRGPSGRAQGLAGATADAGQKGFATRISSTVSIAAKRKAKTV